MSYALNSFPFFDIIEIIDIFSEKEKCVL